MKKLYIALTLILSTLISGCGESANSSKCLNSVKKAFPKSHIYIELDHKFTFIVQDSTQYLKVETMNLTDTLISSVEPLIKLK